MDILRRKVETMSPMKINEILKGKSENQKISIRGWVYRKRQGKNLIFLLVRDASGFIQCTVKKTSSGWSEAERLTIESSLTLDGTPKRDKRAPGGFEISVDSISIIGLAEIFPISKDQSKNFLRDVRHLWLRSRKMNLVMKIRDKVLEFTREFFKNSEFIEVSPPMFISAAVEGGSTLFDLKYFDRILYLTQSSQLYLEILIYSLEKVYCIAPSFRAEKSRTIRHLTEYWHIEGEWPYVKMSDLMDFEEELLSYICQQTLLNCKDELEELKVDLKKLKLVKTPFPRITYSESIDILKEQGVNLNWVNDFGYE
jgi:asparaginyl-tRNA synthetase